MGECWSLVKEELLDAEETESTKHLYSNEDEHIVEAVEKKDQYFNSISEYAVVIVVGHISEFLGKI